MRKMFLSSFRAKVTAMLLLTICSVFFFGNFITYHFTLDSQFNQVRERLKAIAQTAVLLIDVDVLEKIPLNKEGINTPEFKTVAASLQRVQGANPAVKYIYIMKKTDDLKKWKFIVDPEPVDEELGEEGPTSYPGDPYDVSEYPMLIKSWEEPTADEDFTVDDWGVVLSGYAPIRDKSGQTVAILGVDMAAADIYAVQKSIKYRTALVLFLGIIVSILLGIIISGKITKRINKLVEATRHIAEDNFNISLRLKGDDEITELANSLNVMAISLSASRARIQNYFYHVVLSFNKVLEAKDPYTRGHSERVAKYFEAIALRMGYSKEKVETLKKIAELHDIGKVAIQENILNKKERLTDDEWKNIQEHPTVGAEMLKPLLLESEYLAVVRSHHERYDGKGYPDNLVGDKINIFAQIIAVADSYDAMTSNRAYRNMLPKEKAIEELKKNSWTQFNGDIVNVFLEILAKEDL